MQLNLWLFKRKVSKKDFAKRLGICRSHLHRIMLGYPVSDELLLRIEEKTDGWVKPHDIKPHLKPKKIKPEAPNIKQMDAFE